MALVPRAVAVGASCAPCPYTGKPVIPSDALAALKKDAVAAAVSSTVRVVLRSDFGTCGTGWVFPSPVPGLGAILVSRHVVTSTALAKHVFFDLSGEAFTDQMSGHALIAADEPKSASRPCCPACRQACCWADGGPCGCSALSYRALQRCGMLEWCL